MEKTKVKNLLEFTKPDMENWLNSFDTILADCDGVLWNNGVVIDGVPEVLQSWGKELYFVTNNGIKSRHEIWKGATAIGYEISEERIIAPIKAIVDYLKVHKFHKKVYIIGYEAIRTELGKAGIDGFGPGPFEQSEPLPPPDEVGAVIVGFDEHFDFKKMSKAYEYLTSPKTDCLFMATNFDAVHRYPKFRIPGTGALLSALESYVGRKALQFGKPNPAVCAELVKKGKVVPERTLMIGDVCKIDILFGHNCGFQTLLVGTGPNSIYELNEVLHMQPHENRHFIPDFYVPSLADLKNKL